jgi:Fur family transcriptional regulator, ferric uptake regulator
MTGAKRVADWAEHALATLSDAGYRRGGARTAVVELLGRKNCGITAAEIEEELQGEGSSVSRASIYRVLEELDELRLVQRLEVGQDFARYEPLLASGDHHHHMVCERCGRVAPFSDEGLERAIERASERVRFRVGGHEIVLRGLCADCRG